MEAIGKFFTGIILLVINTIVTGLLISKFWGWFVLNIFTDLPRIGIGQGIGLSFFVALFFIGVAKDGDIKKLAGEEQTFWQRCIGGIIGMLLVLFIGWLIHLCI